MEPIDFDNSYFDTFLEVCGLLSNSSNIIDKPSAYRGYLNFRLLFWNNVVVTDSTINDNPTLRSLVLPDYENVRNYIPQDYSELIKQGILKVACRTSQSRPISSRPLTSLLKLQEIRVDRKITSLPQEGYTSILDDILEQNPSSALTYDLDDLSESFHNNINTALKTTFFPDREVQQIVKELIDYTYEHRNYGLNEIRSLLPKSKRNPSIIELDRILQIQYNNTVPKDFKLNIERGMQISPNDIENLRFYIPILSSYELDFYKLAYTRSETLIHIIRNSDKRKNFISALKRMSNDKADLSLLTIFLDEYIKEVNYYINIGFDKRIESILYDPESSKKPLALKIMATPEMSLILFAIGNIVPSLNIFSQIISLLAIFSSKFAEKCDLKSSINNYNKKSEQQILWELKKRNIVLGE